MKNKSISYVLIYLVSIIIANLTVTHFGVIAVIPNAFLFIGLDLTARDKLHDLWENKYLAVKMGMLIFAGSFISYLLNSEAKQIAIASMIAFGLAAIADSVTYYILKDKAKLVRVNGSNIPSALVDSLVFPTLAFGSFLPIVVLWQFLAKVFGGAIWSMIIYKLIPRIKKNKVKRVISLD